MIKRINKIEGIGKFEAMGQSPEFGKMTLIYGENGSGKSTLCTILRSLRDDDPQPLIARKTLCDPASGRASIPQVIEIEIDGLPQPIIFTNGKWDQKYSNIEIFDSTFVEQNVYSGSSIDPVQKKNLYTYWLGEDGVKSAKQIEQLKDEIKVIDDRQKDIIDDIRKIVKSNIDIDTFIKLKQIENIDIEIEKQNKKLESQKNADRIKQHSLLKTIIYNKLDIDKITTLLDRNVGSIGEDVIKMINDHIQSHNMAPKGKAWIEEGLEYATTPDCPFCGQSIGNNPLISNYKKYFDEEYSSFKNEITETITFISDDYSELKQKNIDSIIKENNDAINDFWHSFDNSFSTVNPIKPVNFLPLINDVIAQLKAKAINPADPIAINESILPQYNEIIDSIEQYNKLITTLNLKIQNLRSQITGSIVEDETELSRLRLIKVKFENETIKQLLSEYKDNEDQKNTKDKVKKDAQEKATKQSANILSDYKRSINEYLEIFAADFRIDNYTARMQAKTPTVECGLMINKCLFDTNPNDINSKPCFSNVLSDGDKRSLALAYFLAKLDSDTAVSNKTVIFDDPFNSLDNHRKYTTNEYIFNKIYCCKQVIISSCDYFRLHEINCYNDRLRPLFVHINENNQLALFDIETYTKSDFVNNVELLKNYCIRPTLDIAECITVSIAIRKTIEAAFRYKHPQLVGKQKMFGSIINEIDTSNNNSELYQYKGDIQKLRFLNNFSKPIHHPDKNNPEILINMSQLQVLTKVTIDLVDKMQIV